MLMSFLNSHPNVQMDGEALSSLGPRSYQQVLDHIYSPAPFFVKTKGFKYFYYHPVDDDPNAAVRALSAVDGLHIIHLKRTNLFHTLVSQKVASQTDVWHVPAETPGASTRPTLTISMAPADVQGGFEETRQWEQDGEATFRAHPLLTVTYEDLVDHRDTEFRRITDFLGLRPIAPKTRFRKQNKRPMRAVVDNYDELKAAFSNTEWASFFDE